MLTGVCTCSILLSGFSSSSVRMNSSLSKPYSPSWPKKKKNQTSQKCSVQISSASLHTRDFWFKPCSADLRPDSFFFRSPFSLSLRRHTNSSTEGFCPQPLWAEDLFQVVLRQCSDSSPGSFTAICPVFTNSACALTQTRDFTSGYVNIHTGLYSHTLMHVRYPGCYRWSSCITLISSAHQRQNNVADSMESGASASHDICYLLDVTLVACLGFSLLLERKTKDTMRCCYRRCNKRFFDDASDSITFTL